MSKIKRQHRIKPDSDMDSLTVREWNRLKEADRIILTDDQITPSLLLVYDARCAWKYMRNTNYECLSIRAVYHGKPVFLFRCKVEIELPW